MADSTQDTLAHKQKVLDYATDFCGALLERAKRHDDSKLESPEKEKFDLVGTKSHLSKSEYGSEEYKKSLEMLGDALKHHYENNSHHPQHYPDGIDGMDLLDLVEMYVDWKAASERNKGGRPVAIHRDEPGKVQDVRPAIPHLQEYGRQVLSMVPTGVHGPRAG